MLEAILNFPKQFTYQPIIKNRSRYKPSKNVIILGMGGSNLSAGLLRICDPYLKIISHRNYGLPTLSDKELKNYLIIASSYSGDTEEVIDGFKKALTKKLNVLAISTGGKLLKLAKKQNIAHIQLPNTGIQPRSAIGFILRAVIKAMGLNKYLLQTNELNKLLKPKTLQTKGKTIAIQIKHKIPIIYTSLRNRGLAYNWKIKLNETGKIPAFSNVFSELNHNEINGFDLVPNTKLLGRPFFVIFIEDVNDHPRIIKRMAITEKLYKKNGLPLLHIKLTQANIWQKIFSNLLLADWVAYYSALGYGRDPENVPIISQFKKML